MKETIPDSPDILIQYFIDPPEWDAAKWGATAFLYDPAGVRRDYPGIGLAFQNFDIGKKIFDEWIERFGHVDLHEELRISIIEGPIPSDPEGYTVCISANSQHTVRRKQILDPSFRPTKFARVARMCRMNPSPDSPHLRLFKEHFARVKRYQIFPAWFEGREIKELDESRFIEKAELNFFHSSDLKPKDLEYAAVTAKHEQHAA